MLGKAHVHSASSLKFPQHLKWFQVWSDWPCPLRRKLMEIWNGSRFGPTGHVLSKGSSLSTSSFYASLLQAVDVLCLALCLQAHQHSTSCKLQATSDGCLGCQSVRFGSRFPWLWLFVCVALRTMERAQIWMRFGLIAAMLDFVSMV